MFFIPFLKIPFNIILSPRTTCSLAFSSAHIIPLCPSPVFYTCHMSCSSHSWFGQPNNIGWVLQIIKPLVISASHSPVMSSLLGPNIFHSTLFSNTLSLCSFLSVRHQASHAYNNNRQNYSSVYIYHKFLNSKLEDKRFYIER